MLSHTNNHRFVSQAFFTKAAGRTSSSLSSPLWSPPSWGMAGAEASRAPAVMGRPKATSYWRRWLWHGVSMEVCTSEISTISDEYTHLATSRVSWSSGTASRESCMLVWVQTLIVQPLSLHEMVEIPVFWICMKEFVCQDERIMDDTSL